MLPKVMLTWPTANQSLSFLLLNLVLAMLDKDVAEIQGHTRIVGTPKRIQDNRRRLQTNNICLCGKVHIKDIWDLYDKHVVE
jgi:hypothetical protein